MKHGTQFIIALFVFNLLLSCSGEDKCPPTVNLGTFSIEESSKEWNPYLNYSKAIFIDDAGKELIFDVRHPESIPLLEEKQLFSKCSDDNDQIVTYQYNSKYQCTSLITDDSLWNTYFKGVLDITLRPLIEDEDPNQQKVGDFLIISNLISPLSCSIGNLMVMLVNPRSHSNVEEDYITTFDEFTSDNIVYDDVISNNGLSFDDFIISTSIGEVCFGSIIIHYSKVFGIVQMRLSSGETYYLKELI